MKLCMNMCISYLSRGCLGFIILLLMQLQVITIVISIIVIIISIIVISLPRLLRFRHCRLLYIPSCRCLELL